MKRIEIEAKDAAEAKALAVEKLGPRTHCSGVYRRDGKRMWIFTTEWNEL